MDTLDISVLQGSATGGGSGGTATDGGRCTGSGGAIASKDLRTGGSPRRRNALPVGRTVQTPSLEMPTLTMPIWRSGPSRHTPIYCQR